MLRIMGAGVGFFKPDLLPAAPGTETAAVEKIARALGSGQRGTNAPAGAVKQHVETGGLVPVVAIAPLPDQFIAGLEIDSPLGNWRADGAQHVFLRQADLDAGKVLHGQHVFAGNETATGIAAHKKGVIAHGAEGINEDFPAIRLSGIHPELYSIYQAAKTISVGGDNIVIEDLAFSELVSDRAFRLILGALLLCRYGEVVLNLERKTEETT